jgi:uncharacterized membrane protein HdeD (DUF308 family)
MGTYDREEGAERSKKMVRMASLGMIALGVLSILSPLLVGAGIAVLLGIVSLGAGFAYAALALGTRGTGAFLWRLLVSAVFVVAGSYLVLRRESALVALTAILALAFLFEGLAEVGAYAMVRNYRNSLWLLPNAAASLVIALLIWRNWPASSVWAIGTLVGINLIASGVAPLKFSPSVTKLLWE